MRLNRILLLGVLLCFSLSIASLHAQEGDPYSRAIEAIQEAQATSATRLDLSDYKLTDLPPEIGILQNLETLDVNNNQLTTLPAEIGHLQNLRELDVSTNQLTNLPPEIGALQRLERLNLNNNRLTSLPSEIGQLTNLIIFTVSRNQLTELPNEIRQLGNLQEISVLRNPLTDNSALCFRQFRYEYCRGRILWGFGLMALGLSVVFVMLINRWNKKPFSKDKRKNETIVEGQVGLFWQAVHAVILPIMPFILFNHLLPASQYDNPLGKNEIAVLVGAVMVIFGVYAYNRNLKSTFKMLSFPFMASLVGVIGVMILIGLVLTLCSFVVILLLGLAQF